MLLKCLDRSSTGGNNSGKYFRSVRKARNAGTQQTLCCLSKFKPFKNRRKADKLTRYTVNIIYHVRLIVSKCSKIVPNFGNSS